jgi:hypothetical protein
MTSTVCRKGDTAPKRRWDIIFLAISLYTLALLSTHFRFRHWYPEVWFGDDLYNYLAYLDGKFPADAHNALTAAFENKYRPIFHWSLGTLYETFGENIQGYMTSNWLLHGVNATLVGLLAWRLSRQSLVIAAFSTAVIASSRFALYQVTQVTGWIEGLALTSALVSLSFLLLATEADNWRKANRLFLGAVLAAAITLHIHERYVVMLPWLTMCLYIAPLRKGMPTSSRIWFNVSIALIVFGNYVMRSLVLHLPYFMGTGRQQIKTNYNLIWTHLSQGVSSLFGINKGPEYLVAAPIENLPHNATIYAIVFSTIFSIMLIREIIANYGNIEKSQSFTQYLLLATLAGILLVPAIATIRIEQRWLLAPQACLLLILSKACHKGGPNIGQYKIILFMVAASALVALDTSISKRFDQIFFVYSAQVAKSVRADIKSGNIPNDQSPLNMNLPAEHCLWTLDEGQFFRIYGSGQRVVSCTRP